jgi:hypothetical protein
VRSDCRDGTVEQLSSSPLLVWLRATRPTSLCTCSPRAGVRAAGSTRGLENGRAPAGARAAEREDARALRVAVAGLTAVRPYIYLRLPRLHDERAIRTTTAASGMPTQNGAGCSPLAPRLSCANRIAAGEAISSD